VRLGSIFCKELRNLAHYNFHTFCLIKQFRIKLLKCNCKEVAGMKQLKTGHSECYFAFGLACLYPGV